MGQLLKGDVREMELSFNTENRTSGVGLKALQLYSSKQYEAAIKSFQDILDLEPNNWDARLLLGACYYKTSQFITAQRIFNYIASNCKNLEILSKTRQAFVRHSLSLSTAQRISHQNSVATTPLV